MRRRTARGRWQSAGAIPRRGGAAVSRDEVTRAVTAYLRAGGEVRRLPAFREPRHWAVGYGPGTSYEFETAHLVFMKGEQP